jgi:hypothetical protein
VSIGTIEVTVVPPARPGPAAGGTGQGSFPGAGAVPDAAGPRTAGAQRLRDGLRRWYGIAQG